MRILELFAGTGSIGKWARQNGHEVVSLDLDKKSGATHTCDIRMWDYMVYAPGYFDVCWASPPCTQWSRCRTTGPPRDLEGARGIVRKTLEIIDYLQPTIFYIENPQTGMLKEQDIMAHLPYFDVDYCAFGYLYRKRTRIWSNIAKPNMTRLCGGLDCHAIVWSSTTRRYSHIATFGGIRNFSLAQKHSIPPDLVEYIMRLQQ